MARLTPALSANRTVRQYTEEHYLPAAAGHAARCADHGAAGAGIYAWQAEVARRWSDVRFGTLKVDVQDGEMTFDVEVHLGGLDPGAVRVELYADPQDGGAPFRQEMHEIERHANGSMAHIYLAVPLEIGRVLWQK